MSNQNSFTCYLKTIINPIFFIVWMSLIILSYFFFDKPVALFMHSHMTHTIHEIADAVTFFGFGATYLFGFFTLWLVARFILKNERLMHVSGFLFFSVLVTGLICDFLKMLLGRARPDELFDKSMYGFYFFQKHAHMWSFPSGHASIVSAVTMALSLVLPKYWWMFLMVAVLTAFSRIVLTQHYISDVMAGWYLGSMVVMYIYEILTQKWARLAV